MKVSENAYALENLDELVDTDFFSVPEQQELIQRAWSSFLAEKKKRELPPLSPEEIRERLKTLDDIVFTPVKKKSSKQEEYDKKYLGALIRLHRAFTKLDAGIGKIPV